VNARDEEDEQGRKIPLFLLVVGQGGANVAACKVALRTIPGIRLGHFTDPEAALAWAKGKDLVAVVVDDRLPSLSGLAFIRHLHTLAGIPRPHTVLLSDAPHANALGAARDIGVDDVVPSTVPRNRLAALLRSAIGLRLAERASWQQTDILAQTPAWAHSPATPKSAWNKRLAAAAALLVLLLLALLWQLHPKPQHAIASAPNTGAVNPTPPANQPGKGLGLSALPGTLPGLAGHGNAGAGGSGTSAQAIPPTGTSANANGAGSPPGTSHSPSRSALGNGVTTGAGTRAPAHSNSGFLVLDSAGRVISANAPDVPRVPASTIKVLTAVTALATLGSRFRFTTRLVAHGMLKNGSLDGTLALVGGGDPMLRTADLDAAASSLERRGIRRIRGNLLIDATAFTMPEYNPHWSPSDRPYAYAAGTSAVSIDEGTSLHAVRGVSTPQAVLDQQAFAGIVLRRALQAHHITVDGSTRYGHSDGGTLLWTHTSPALPTLLTKMLAESDNHVAEQILREIGLVATGVGSESAGIDRIRSDLAGRGIATNGLALYDGSGLSLDNRVTPKMLATLLWQIGRTPAGIQIHDALPRVGLHGDIILAKTGRVGSAEGLVGYLDRPPAGSFSFAFLGAAASGAPAQTLQEGQERQLHHLALLADGASQ
jgi:D-alanyl-D-alanine carboxypeptidase/D-alanyl-D-alanine-endopeptidase (penicillin-binding protein 4)